MRLFLFIISVGFVVANKAQPNFKFADNEMNKSSFYVKLATPLFKNPMLQFAPKVMCLKLQSSTLPFFCNMEDKFRNRFHIYLKLRLGNDEAYTQLITLRDK